MQFSLSASGTPAAVRVAIEQQLARAAHENPHTAVVGSAISDALSAEFAGLGPDEVLTVSASVSVTTRADQRGAGSVGGIQTLGQPAEVAIHRNVFDAPSASASTINQPI